MSFIHDKVFNYLCPPGNGIFTTHSMASIKKAYQEKLYPHSDLETVQGLWEKSLLQLSSEKKPLLLGIPTDAGAGVLKGSNWGPIYIRDQIAHLQNFLDLGDVKCIPHLIHDDYLSPEIMKSCRIDLYHKDLNLPVSPLSIAEDFCSEIYRTHSQAKIMGLGGDNSTSYPLIKTWLKNQYQLGRNPAILHLDAHTDLMNSRLGIPLTFGSWANQLLPHLKNPQQFIQIGLRSSSHQKDYWESKYGIKQIWAKDILDNQNYLDLILKTLRETNTDSVYISIDIDVLDPKYAWATGTPEPNGLEPHHLITILESIHQECEISGADLSEVAPHISFPHEQKLTPEPETTLLSARLIVQRLMEILCQ
ncbi:MAG: arginase [Halobacteriovoraceae bacterium]|nr:arginase [Halobacteriovoraceae bacterium]|tara:strand:+ start:11364 stop:12452 length:1089 start_codon:yes stop_codon:yes gene_type:complete